jgi:hypothetical protein
MVLHEVLNVLLAALISTFAVVAGQLQSCPAAAVAVA